MEKIEDGFIRFLGMELRLWQGGLHISQAGYVRDLLRQHGVEESDKGLTVPCGREWLQDEDTDEEQAVADEMLVKMAQKATGETLWLSTRSRPELAHSVACMAARALNKPQRALEIHKRMVQYLARTADYGMYYYHDKSEPLLHGVFRRKFCAWRRAFVWVYHGPTGRNASSLASEQATSDCFIGC